MAKLTKNAGTRLATKIARLQERSKCLSIVDSFLDSAAKTAAAPRAAQLRTMQAALLRGASLVGAVKAAATHLTEEQAKQQAVKIANAAAAKHAALNDGIRTAPSRSTTVPAAQAGKTLSSF